MLQFIDVQKSYGTKKLLDIPSLELPRGIYWLQGANGTGKTSLLRMLAGILPFDGSILLQGLALKKDPVAYRRSIGWADAEPVYPDFLTGKDLLNFYRDIQQPRPGQVDELIDRLGVAPWLGSRTATWSAGMCKKVSLLLAFIGEAALVTLDEPLVTLDQKGVTALYTLIQDRHRQFGTSFILSSHQDIPDHALSAIQQLMLMNRSIELV
jgi:ABC-2 type transport system ATP-binding protein